jgi:hypothetical protein
MYEVRTHGDTIKSVTDIYENPLPCAKAIGNYMTLYWRVFYLAYDSVVSLYHLICTYMYICSLLHCLDLSVLDLWAIKSHL